MVNIIITCFLLFSCRNTKVDNSDLILIPVDFDQKVTAFPLTDIAEDITAIELEFSDESMLNIEKIHQVLLHDNHIILSSSEDIFLYGIDGKFICTIGSRGQGPQEYNSVRNITIDEKNNILYINSLSEIICYDLNENKCLKKSTLFRDKGIMICVMYFANDELLVVGEKREFKEIHKILDIYRLNDELQLMDSCRIRDIYYRKNRFHSSARNSYFSNVDSRVSFYYPEYYHKDINISKKVLYDTLYRVENGQLIPEMKLNIKNSNRWIADEKFDIAHIYRSSRFIFIDYFNKKNSVYCYDLETGKTYNDLTFEPDKCNYYPVDNNPEFLFRLYTKINSDDFEEPNPTLYLIKLKKTERL